MKDRRKMPHAPVRLNVSDQLLSIARMKTISSSRHKYQVADYYDAEFLFLFANTSSEISALDEIDRRVSVVPYNRIQLTWCHKDVRKIF
jgi:hypothetical protein